MPARKNKCLELKKKARYAKKRLSSGYWDIVKQRKEIALTSAEEVLDKAAIGAYCRRNYGAEERQAHLVADMIEDERLYKKVCAFLASDTVVSNPIGLLLDKDKLGTLDEAGKTRYVLQMSNKYRDLCERFYNEKKL